MNIKNNYNECLTNLACSIRKYFGLEYKHNTLEYIDDILNTKKPKNVVLILFDGMGSNIIDRILNKNDFLLKNRLKAITTVFPATTTAATTSIKTGLDPIEHGWLAWNMYIKPIDKTITIYRDTEKETGEICNDFINVKNKLVEKDTVDDINTDGKYSAMRLYPFGHNRYNGLDEMLNIIATETNKDGKKYIYAYDDEPDHSMHDFGPDSIEAKILIEERNKKIEKFSKDLKDTIVIITADHGHKKAEHIFLNNYPEILKMLERTTSIEQRAVSFKVKEEYRDVFKNEFNKLFGEYFTLYDRQDIIESNLFGYGTPNELFNDAIGDYIAIAEDSNKCIVSEGDKVLVSQHAGYSDDEIYVPIIVIDKTK